jgi:hypothetical protein
MNKTEVEQMFEALTNNDLREMYDKYNIWYSRKDIEEKSSSIRSMDKYV